MSESNAFSRKSKVGAGSLALLVGAGTLFTATPAFAAPGDAVSLDASLQACINQVLGQPAETVITEGDLAGLTGSLNCQGYNLSAPIVSLDGLEFATGLTGINVTNNDVSDLTPLAGLTALTQLNVAGNVDIDSVAPLAGLTNLQGFRGTGLENVTDWDSISTLTALQEVALAGTGITDVSFLSGMTALINLDLGSNTGLSDLSPLSGLDNLQWLVISNTGVTNFDAVGAIPSIEWLDADGLNVSDFSGILNLTNLTEFVLGDVTSTAWNQLNGITVPLEYLYLSGEGITDVSWLEGLNIEALTLYDTPLTSFDSVAAVEGLRFLYVENSNFSDVSPLAGLTSLETVYLDGNHVADISPLEVLGLSTLSAADQTIQASATTGNLFANPIVSLDGSSVVFPDAQYSAADNGFLFEETGPFSTVWSVPTPSSSSVSTEFSGTLSVSVADGTELPALNGLSVARDMSDPSHSVMLSVSPVAEAASYTFTLTPVSALGAPTVTHTYTPTAPGEFPLDGVRVAGLLPDTEYSIAVFYTDADGVVSAVSPTADQAPVLHRTDIEAEDSEDAPALQNVAATSDKDNSIKITFDSLESVGGTGGFGDAVLYTVQYRLAGTDAEWDTLTAEGTNATDILTLSNIYAGTYEVLVSYTTDTGAESEPVALSNIIVAGQARPDGDGGTDGNGGNAAPGAVNANNLNNSASDMNMGQVGLLAGGGLMLAAAGALMLGARRTQRNA